MRILAVTQNITLDGSIEMLDDWFDPGAQDDLTTEMRRQQSRNDALLLGRGTFEAMRGFWPHQHDDTTGMSAHLDQVHKYVVSTTVTDPAWQHSTVVASDPVGVVRELKQQRGGDIVVTGSIALTHTLIAAGLVDEYRLFVYPAVQGRGRRLGPDGQAVLGLRLEESTAFGNGVVYCRYSAAPATAS